MSVEIKHIGCGGLVGHWDGPPLVMGLLLKYEYIRYLDGSNPLPFTEMFKLLFCPDCERWLDGDEVFKSLRAVEKAYQEIARENEIMIDAMYELTPDEIEKRIEIDSAKYELGFRARVMKNFNPYSPRIIWRGLGERIKHWYGRKFDFRYRWLRWRYGPAFLGTTRKNGKTVAILR